MSSIAEVYALPVQRRENLVRMLGELYEEQKRRAEKKS
jgi:hypothetical protein